MTSFARGTLRICTLSICSRPRRSGRGTVIRRSNLPGRSKAGSNTSGRLVAAIRMTPSLASKPSISTNNWFRVCSRSSLPPPIPAPRCRPMASISSTKTIHGECFLACSNISRTREALTPTNISTKSDPEIEKNGTSASPAIARANKVLPVPGGPTSKAPFGILPPRRVNLDESRRKSMISVTSCLASSHPATSSNVTRLVSSVSSLALLFPKDSAPRPPDCIWRMKNIHTAINSNIGNHEIRIDRKIGISSSFFTLTSTFRSSKRCTRFGSSGTMAR